MKYDPNKYHRKSIRLKGYDYSQAGLYFVTICTLNRECLFGDIENGEMKLNDAGEMIKRWYYELSNKFKDIKCDQMVIMPNHIHFIIENIGCDFVGADLCVCPYESPESKGADLCVCPYESPESKGTDLCVCPNESPESGEHVKLLGEHVGSPLHNVIQWFKTMTTNNYIRGVKNNGWVPFNGKLWQRNYYEHIIRNERSYQNIYNYILNNPAKWGNDRLK